MISRDEIKKLAGLARIGIGDEEATELAGEIDAILDYVGQVKEVVGDGSDTPLKVRGAGGDMNMNVFREDTDPNESGVYTDAILKEMPATEKGYLKVKKIL